MKVDFFRHALDAADAARVADVLASPFLTTGPVCKSVEAQLCDYFDVPHAILTNSWTNGALATLLTLELQPGDEVIVPAMTFIGAVNIVLLAGGTPVFVDADPDTLLVTPEAVAEAVGPRTRAVMPVHLYGQMCDVAGMRRVLDEHSGSGRHIFLFEDAAHCFEGKRDGERPGRHSDAAIFSFYATKNLTCGEGGAVISRNAELSGKVRESRLHGMSAIAIDRFAGGSYNHWDMERLGTKANLCDLLAALLPPQIAAIDAILPRRQQLAERYRSSFTGGPLRLVRAEPSCASAEHLFVLGVPGGARDQAIERLNAAGIEVTINFRAVPAMHYYRRKYPEAASRCPIACRWGNEVLSLPLFPSLTREEQSYVIETVHRDLYPLASS
jgi:UDP-4-amino-4-deoxy-L-arabinose-oxoglutarate aminotransferase